MMIEIMQKRTSIKEIVVISGKGGTGKTSVVSALAALADRKVLCDADVDAADLHLIMHPEIRERHDFVAGVRPAIDKTVCTECGRCREVCKWNAIGPDFTVDAIACEGCGVCAFLCPVNAIALNPSNCGEWFLSETRYGPMVHARLGIAQENSGKLVALVRQEAKKLAENGNLNLIITDGPPGVGCPVIASIGGASAVLIVTEPSVSGLHDMKRIVQLTKHFRVPAMLCVNKYDINHQIAKELEKTAGEANVAFLGKIPFDPVFTRSMVQGQTVFEYDAASIVCHAIAGIWEKIKKILEVN
jgi:MinD superfamily P-loop ATPase